MIKNLAGLFLALIFTNFSLNSLANQKISLYADVWCPYNCVPNSDYEGLLVEVAKYAFKKHNIDVEYKVKPWIECVNDFNKGEIDGIIGASTDEVFNFVPPSNEIAISNISAFTLDDTFWVYERPESLHKRSVGIVEAYSYDVSLKNYLYTIFVTNPDSVYISYASKPVEDNVKLLMERKIFTYIEDDKVVGHYAQVNKLARIRKASSVQSPQRVYVLFPDSNPNSKLYAKYMSDAVFEMKENGMMKKLIRKYNFDKVGDDLNIQ